ncbi:O-antigen polysaccharide polymerase Wzy family protein [Staphylococcus sp. IVB6181]|uniref:O-antigen polysaccharide polymerase Wzy family protein n=1 Tax=Staphylococcus sp. IVB6181 TaxID=2929481 RepID=UPI0021CF63F4|nr:O-antigen polysaccharide polymerase Wzy family protein [Staphylococcus sp. IVB6181]
MVRLLRWSILGIAVIMLALGIIFSNITLLFSALLLFFLNNIIYGLESFNQRVIFFMFNVTFFVFLMGRMVVSKLFHYHEKDFKLLGTYFTDQSIIFNILIMLSLSLFCLFLGYALLDREVHRGFDQFQPIETKYKQNIRTISLFVFAVAIVFKLVYLAEAIQASQAQGYYAFFSNFKSNLPGAFVLISRMFPVAFFIYLATLPAKKKAWLAIAAFLLVDSLSVMTGSRSDFMLDVLILFIYFCYRNRLAKDTQTDKWFGKKTIITGVVLAPILLAVMNFVGNNRGGTKTEGGFFDALLSFFFSQGISVNVIGYTIEKAKEIPDKIYSIGPLTEYAVFNIWGNLTGGQGGWSGQSVERALDGYQYSHTISYVIMKDLYLKGVGYGSSFVAETYHDFGYVGMMFASLIIGILIALFTRMLTAKHIMFIAAALIMARMMLFIPRASTIAFIIDTFSPANIFTVIVIFGLERVLRPYLNRRRNHRKQEL